MTGSRSLGHVPDRATGSGVVTGPATGSPRTPRIVSARRSSGSSERTRRSAMAGSPATTASRGIISSRGEGGNRSIPRRRTTSCPPLYGAAGRRGSPRPAASAPRGWPTGNSRFSFTRGRCRAACSASSSPTPRSSNGRQVLFGLVRAHIETVLDKCVGGARRAESHRQFRTRNVPRGPTTARQPILARRGRDAPSARTC